jgi:hypothetical protein
VQRKLSLTRPEELVARCTRALTSPVSIAARTSDSFSFSADERGVAGVAWRDGRLPELTERDGVREAMTVPASRVCYHATESRR